MARSFFIGVAWTAVAIVSGLAAMISYSEAGRLSGGSKVLAGAGAVVLAVAALFTLVKGRIAIREARRIAMRGSMSRRTGQLDHIPELELPGLARDGSGPVGPIRQLNDAQEALVAMRPVCRTSERISSVAKRLGLRLEPVWTFPASVPGS